MTSCFVARISNPGERFGKPFYDVDVPSPLGSSATATVDHRRTVPIGNLGFFGSADTAGITRRLAERGSPPGLRNCFDPCNTNDLSG